MGWATSTSRSTCHSRTTAGATPSTSRGRARTPSTRCGIFVSSSAGSAGTSATPPPSSARATEADRAAWTGTGAKDWANESFLITTAETVRYGVRTEAGCWDEADHETLDLDEATKVVTVDEASLDTHLPIIKQRLTQAGIRLGHLLNRAVGGA